MKEIIGKYRITDCENDGDIYNAINCIKSISGCTFIGSFWDGNDCGKAYVMFSFPSIIFVKVYNKLKDCSVSFNEDINDYIDKPIINGILLQNDYVPFKEFNKTCEKLYNNVSDIINGKVYLRLMFEENKYGFEIVNKVVDELGKDTTSIVCYTSDFNGKWCYNVLLLTDINNITEDVKKHIGGMFCSYGWFHEHKIYGSFEIHSVLYQYSSFNVSKFHKLASLIISKHNLVYLNHYTDKKTEISYNDYLNDGKLNIDLDLNGCKYDLAQGYIQFNHFCIR